LTRRLLDSARLPLHNRTGLDGIFMSHQRPGSFKLLSIAGIPVYFHWTFPLGGLLISAIFAGNHLQQAVIYVLAYVALIAFHELGHVMVARVLGLKVFAINIYGLGGNCYLQVPKTVPAAFSVYSAGLIVQSGLFAVALTYAIEMDSTNSVLETCLLNTFLYVNAFLFLTNILPSKRGRRIGTDGFVLWNLIRHVFRNEPHPVPSHEAPSPVYPPETSLLSIPNLKPAGFVVGIEILNDNKTPMDFVMEVLQKYLGVNRDEAMKLMLNIHTRGGLLLPYPDMDKAQRLADAISEHAQEHGQSLVCRAVDSRR
jgi:ATP-dependent Clp protease adaptor protein ClpS